MAMAQPLALLSGLLVCATASAQISMTATTRAYGVHLQNNQVIGPGVDVTSGFVFRPFPSSTSTIQAEVSLDVEQDGCSAVATMRSYANNTSPGLGTQSQSIEFTVSSAVPTTVDVRVAVDRDEPADCFGGPIGSIQGGVTIPGVGQYQAIGCPPVPFVPFGCERVFRNVPIDSSGLTIHATAQASIGYLAFPPSCLIREAVLGCRIEIVPNLGTSREFGVACGTSLSSQRLPAPLDDEFNITVDDPGATLGVLMIGSDEIALPLLGCTLYTTPFVSLPLPLDANGSITFQSGLPDLPIQMQAATVENLVIHMSNGLHGCLR